jgi:hypothetical protein
MGGTPDIDTPRLDYRDPLEGATHKTISPAITVFDPCHAKL